MFYYITFNLKLDIVAMDQNLGGVNINPQFSLTGITNGSCPCIATLQTILYLITTDSLTQAHFVTEA